jgi:hypothetical protein
LEVVPETCVSNQTVSAPINQGLLVLVVGSAPREIGVEIVPVEPEANDHLNRAASQEIFDTRRSARLLRIKERAGIVACRGAGTGQERTFHTQCIAVEFQLSVFLREAERLKVLPPIASKVCGDFPRRSSSDYLRV